MTADHALLLARLLIGLAFAVSATGKLRDLRAFRAAVADLEQLPRRWTGPAVALVVCAELGTAIAMLAGGPLLVPGFAGAAVLLLAFSLAIAVVLRRRGRVSCNCFGATSRLLTAYDLVRNVLLSAVAAGGIHARSVSAGADPSDAEVALAALVAATLLILLVNVGDVIRTLRRPFWVPP